MTSLRREIIEETSLEVSNLEPVFVSTKYERNAPMYFLLIAWKGNAKQDNVVLSSEHSTYEWVTAEQFMTLDPTYRYVAERELNINTTDFLRDIVRTAFKQKRELQC